MLGEVDGACARNPSVTLRPVHEQPNGSGQVAYCSIMFRDVPRKIDQKIEDYGLAIADLMDLSGSSDLRV